MTNAYSFDGMVIAVLLFICTCAYGKRIPRLNSLIFSEKKGFLGTFSKAAVIGIRLHWIVSLLCLVTAGYVLLIQ
ncbi:hypothetical protein CAOG_009748 [Capsaspora owczarzaki ATCC 30864]|uniref:Protein kish n=1 Tax=Capsaspora owczarzaki (strain ATCC 30864) TaxID=595528 RepID=A0A0D2UE21_CAPO3|nr:hypothetical protein CAOG_009748 [Capsaspora owczarzaki ATCC 30864]